MTTHGIDVSSHNGAIAWDKVDTDFVILRAGWSWYAGGMNIDTRFLANVEGATKASIPWGVYLYAYDKSTSAAVIAANRLADLLAEYKMQYPVWYDIEDNQYIKMAKATNTEITKAFLDTIQSRGFYAGLYTYTNFANNYLNMKDLTKYDFWVADYTGKVGYTGAYGMWQNSAKGKISGISTVVDTNICYKDYPNIIKTKGLNGFSPATITDNTELLAELDTLRKEYNELSEETKILREKLDAVKNIVS